MDNKNKCGPGTHYDEETNSCLLDEVEEPTEVESTNKEEPIEE